MLCYLHPSVLLNIPLRREWLPPPPNSFPIRQILVLLSFCSSLPGKRQPRGNVTEMLWDFFWLIGVLVFFFLLFRVPRSELGERNSFTTCSNIGISLNDHRRRRSQSSRLEEEKIGGDGVGRWQFLSPRDVCKGRGGAVNKTLCVGLLYDK